MIAKKLFAFFIPGGLLFLAAVVLVRGKLLVPWLPQIVQIAPGAILAVGVLLGWRFNRSRLVFALLMLAVADRALLNFAQDSTVAAKFIYNSIVILLPLNLALLNLVKERGIITPHGLLRIFSIAVQPLAITLIYLYRFNEFDSYLNFPVFKSPLLAQPVLQGLPQPVLIVLTASFLLLIYGLAMRRGPIEKGIAWAWAGVCYTLITRSTGAVSTFYFCTAGLVLIVSIVESTYAMAFRDELTGLPARRSLNEFFARLGSHYTLAMVDIDFFKKVNDNYGHDVGDQVLAMVASKLARVRGGGRAFRYGGEEFSLVFAGKPLDETIPYLEQLRVEIESSAFIIRGRSRPRKKPQKKTPGKSPRKKLSVTVSIGAAESGGQHPKPNEVIKAADQALYRAKKGGRNRVCT